MIFWIAVFASVLAVVFGCACFLLRYEISLLKQSLFLMDDVFAQSERKFKELSQQAEHLEQVQIKERQRLRSENDELREKYTDLLDGHDVWEDRLKQMAEELDVLQDQCTDSKTFRIQAMDKITALLKLSDEQADVIEKMAKKLFTLYQFLNDKRWKQSEPASAPSAVLSAAEPDSEENESDYESCCRYGCVCINCF